MINAQLNYFDMVVLGIMFLSCIFAFFRGFVKEILSLIGWVAAGAITLYFFKPFAQTLEPNFSSPKIADLCAIVVLYLGSLMGFAIFNRIIIKILRSGSGIGFVDNMLGLVFGALRGALIVSLGYFMLTMATQEGNRPEWLESAKTRPYAEKGAVMLASVARPYMEDVIDFQNKAKDSIQNTTAGFNTRSINTRQLDSVDVNSVTNDIKDKAKEGSGQFDQFLKDLGNKR